MTSGVQPKGVRMEKEEEGPRLLKGKPHFDPIYSRRQLGTFTGTMEKWGRRFSQREHLHCGW